ncbi:pentapeptide repeat-containing protein [Paenibacillus sp. A3]|uniref:pentapeptide repeat-containing protein n=1 Tax=Paenibacillus sp. A3 TaxID=1337054 RepID=UPI0034DFB4A6
MNCKLNAANLTNADLSGADLTGVDVWQADFTGAKLYYTVMQCSRINEAILSEALYDETTVWPEGFTPQKIK